ASRFSLWRYTVLRLPRSSPTRRSSDLPPRLDRGLHRLRRPPELGGHVLQRAQPLADHMVRVAPAPEGDVGLGAAREPVVGEEDRSEEHTSELQSRENLVCRLLPEKKQT